jgi:hypothetical protein
MPAKKRPDWQVRIYGEQLKEIDLDLMAHIVIMLGRELMAAASDPDELEGDSAVEGGSHE